MKIDITKARRHMQRAQELLGFGEYSSKFGENYNEVNDDVKTRIYEDFTYDQLKLQMVVNKGEQELVCAHIASRTEVLSEAIRRNDKPIIKLILKHDRFKNAHINEFSILKEAIEYGDVEVVNMLLETGRFELNYTLSNEKRQTMLYIAIQLYERKKEDKYLQIAELLIENGSDVNSQIAHENPTKIFDQFIIHSLSSFGTTSEYEASQYPKANRKYNPRVVDLVERFLQKGATFDEYMLNFVTTKSERSVMFKNILALMNERISQKETS